MTNREKFSKDIILKLNDDVLFTIMCNTHNAYPYCSECTFRDADDCANEFKKWLHEEAEEEENDKS